MLSGNPTFSTFRPDIYIISADLQNIIGYSGFYFAEMLSFSFLFLRKVYVTLNQNIKE